MPRCHLQSATYISENVSYIQKTKQNETITTTAAAAASTTTTTTLLLSPPLSKREGIVTLAVTLCVCPPSRLYYLSIARRISLGGEGNVLYPVLCSYYYYFYPQ